MMTEALISRKMPVAAPQCWECCTVANTHGSARTVKKKKKRSVDEISPEGTLGKKIWRTYQNAFTGPLLLAARTFETDKGPADKAEGGVFWHLFASSAGLPVIVLEDDVVVVGQLEETRRRPLVVLHEQSLHRGRRRRSRRQASAPQDR